MAVNQLGDDLGEVRDGLLVGLNGRLQVTRPRTVDGRSRRSDGDQETGQQEWILEGRVGSQMAQKGSRVGHHRWLWGQRGGH